MGGCIVFFFVDVCFLGYGVRRVFFFWLVLWFGVDRRVICGFAGFLAGGRLRTVCF